MPKETLRSVRKEYEHALSLLVHHPDNYGLVELDEKGKPFNAVMRSHRLRKGMSQKDLAEVIKTTSQFISHLETFFRYPFPETAVVIADLLGTSVDELFPVWLRFFSSADFLVQQRRAQLDFDGRVSQLSSIARLTQLQIETLVLEDLDQVDLEWLLAEVSFNEEEKNVLRFRLGIGEEDTSSLHKTAEITGIDRTTVEKIEKRIISRLRRAYQTRFGSPSLG